jgi:hypothetical protein
MVSNSVADNGGDILKPGEVEEKNKTKDGDNYLIARGAKDAPTSPTSTLSDPSKTPWEDAYMDKNGAAAPVNINTTINLFLDLDLSDQNAAPLEDAIKDDKGPAASCIFILFLDSDTSKDEGSINPKINFTQAIKQLLQLGIVEEYAHRSKE